MIDVPMCNTNPDNFFSLAVGKVWYRTIDTKLILIGKLETHIDDDHLILVFKSHTVEAYLLCSTEWDHTKGLLLE